MAFTGNYTTNTFKTGLLNGDFDFAVDTIKIALYTNSDTLNADTTAYTTTGEVVASGYTAGGNTLTPTVSSSGGTSFVTFANILDICADSQRGFDLQGRWRSNLRSGLRFGQNFGNNF